MAGIFFRRKGVFCLLLFMISCFAAVVVARHALVGLLAHWVLHRLYPQQEGCVSGYVEAKWEGKVLSISGIEASTPEEHLQIERIEVILGLKPHLFVFRPQWTKKTEHRISDRHDALLRLLASRHLRFDIVEGRYSLPDEHIVFSLESGEGDEPCWHLKCYGGLDVRECSFLEMFVSMHERGARIAIESKSMVAGQLASVAKIIDPRWIKGIEGMEGHWSGHVALDFDRQWHVVSFDMELALSEGSIGPFTNLAGHLSWTHETDPQFHLEGWWDVGEKKEQLVFDGTGQFVDGAFLGLDAKFFAGDKLDPMAIGTVFISAESISSLAEGSSSTKGAKAHVVADLSKGVTHSGIHFKGDVEFKEGTVNVVAQEVYGDLSDLCSYFDKTLSFMKFPEWVPQGIEGEFYIKDHDLSFQWPSYVFYVRASISHATIPIMNVGTLEGCAIQAAYDSKLSVFTLSSCSGDLRLGQGMLIQLEMAPSQFSCSTSEIRGSIDGVVKYAGATLLQCSGKLKVMPQEGFVEFIPEGSAVLGTRIEEGLLRFSNNALCVEKVRWDDCTLFIEMAWVDALPVFRYRFAKDHLVCTGDGAIDFQKGVVRVTPAVEFPWMGQRVHFKPKESIYARWDPRGSVVVDGGRWEEKSTRSSLAFSKICWNYFEGGTEIDGGSFRVASSLATKIWPSLYVSSEWLEGKAKYVRNSSGYELYGTLEDSEWGWEGFSKPLKTIQWRCTPSNILIGAKTKIGDEDVTGTLQVESATHLGLLKVQKAGSASSLNILFQGQERFILSLQKVSGEAFGIRADLKNVGDGRNILTGSVDVNFDQVRSILPDHMKATLEKMQVGRRFGFDGEIHLTSLKQWEAKGSVEGTDCVLFGFPLHKLEGSVDLNPRSVQFSQVVIQDKGLNASIPRLHFAKVDDGIWTVQCPLLRAKDLKPSVLRGEKEKPFVIRNLTFSGVEGTLGRCNDLQGKCTIHFTNAWKKESTLLDIPRNFLKDLGLEPSLFVPVHGEFVGHFENGKLLFTELKGAYSDEEKTRFVLSDTDEDSYIDFDGKLHINLTMKQSAMLKIGESLILGIRGSLLSPRYVLIP